MSYPKKNLLELKKMTLEQVILYNKELRKYEYENNIPLKSNVFAASDNPARSPVSSHIPVIFIKFPNINANTPDTTTPPIVPSMAAYDFLLNPAIIKNVTPIDAIDISTVIISGLLPFIMPGTKT